MENHNGLTCPFCQSEMKKEFIQSGTRLAWVPKVSKLSAEPSLTKGSVLLSEQSRFSINHVDAFLCESCNKVIIDYESNEQEQ
ncbi:PF20097 family protein [Planococcus maritimus]|nr:PF20097 family protein [Planococcus sp. SK3692]MDE4084365.1 PF20097 family protein [Planococcus maritimus]